MNVLKRINGIRKSNINDLKDKKRQIKNQQDKVVNIVISFKFKHFPNSNSKTKCQTSQYYKY